MSLRPYLQLEKARTLQCTDRLQQIDYSNNFSFDTWVEKRHIILWPM